MKKLKELFMKKKVERKYTFAGKEKKITIEQDEFTDDTVIVLRQIVAVRDFTLLNGTTVTKGELGGWIESENNLSHMEGCWIDEESYVYSGSSVTGNAYLRRSKVFNESMVSDYAYLEDSRVFDRSTIEDNADIRSSVICKGTKISEKVRIEESEIRTSTLKGKTFVQGSKLKHVMLRYENDSSEPHLLTCSFVRVDMDYEFRVFGNAIIEADCDWMDVFIRHRRLYVHAKTTFRDVHADKVFLSISSETTLEHVNFDKLSQMIVVFGKVSQKLLGRLKEKITISGFLQLSGENGNVLNGAIKIFGSWNLSNTRLSDSVQLIGKEYEDVSLNYCSFKDVSMVSLAENYSSKDEVILRELELENDDHYMIQ